MTQEEQTIAIGNENPNEETITNGHENPTEEVKEKSPIKASSESNQIIFRRTLYAAGIGLIPFPVVDAALILGVQIWMIRDLSKVYNVEFKEKLVGSFITTLVGNLGVVGGIKLIPGVGSLIGGFSTALAAGAATFAIGKVFTQHFSQGGTLLDFDPITSRAYFQKAFEEGKLVVSDLQEAEKDSKKLTGIKEFWNRWIKKSPKKNGMTAEQKEEETATLADLQKTNQELKLAILKLQETMESLKEGKKK